jgi:hypothetical protein
MVSSKKTGKKKKRRAKTPPPKGKDPYGVNSYGVEPRTSVASIEPGQLDEDWGQSSWLREQAAIHYITSMEGISLRGLHEISPFNSVCQNTLERWSSEDNWPTRRQEYFQSIRLKIEARLAEKMVATRVAQLEKLDSIFQTLMADLPGAAVGSKEGIVNAIVRLVESSDRMRDKISKEVVPENLGGVVPGSAVQLAPTLDEGDARVMVKAVLRKRREGIRAKKKAEAERKLEDSDRKPKLKLLKDGKNG